MRHLAIDGTTEPGAKLLQDFTPSLLEQIVLKSPMTPI
jgi:hypothetical protein